jgi:hypothetical protein
MGGKHFFSEELRGEDFFSGKSGLISTDQQKAFLFNSQIQFDNTKVPQDDEFHLPG